jgi:hypothetical protein
MTLLGDMFGNLGALAAGERIILKRILEQESALGY